MLRKVRGWIEHRTNPQHVFCRVVTLLMWYDRMWSRVFGARRLTKKQIYEAIVKTKISLARELDR